MRRDIARTGRYVIWGVVSVVGDVLRHGGGAAVGGYQGYGD